MLVQVVLMHTAQSIENQYFALFCTCDTLKFFFLKLYVPYKDTARVFCNYGVISIPSVFFCFQLMKITYIRFSFAAIFQLKPHFIQ